MQNVVRYVDSLNPADPLLQRSLMWTQLITLDKWSERLDVILGGICSTELVICILHAIVNNHTRLVQSSTIQGLTKLTTYLYGRLSGTFIDKLKETNGKDIAIITGMITQKIIAISEGKAKYYKHDLVLLSLSVFAKCFSTYAYKASDEGDGSFLLQFERAIRIELNDWLGDYLPPVISQDGKCLCCPVELQIWSQLFEIGDQFVGIKKWSEPFSNRLADRIKDLQRDHMIQIFYMDTDKYHHELGKTISESLFSCITTMLQEDEKPLLSWFQSLISEKQSIREKTGSILSQLLVRKWPLAANPTAVLRHVLEWTRIRNFLEFRDTQELMEAFTKEARGYIEEAYSCLQLAYAEIISGGITLEKLKIVTHKKYLTQFTDLFSLYKVKYWRDLSVNLKDIINIRQNEVAAFEDHKLLVGHLLITCRTTEIDVPLKGLDDRMAITRTALRLSDICNPITFQGTAAKPSEGFKPQLTFFNMSPLVMAMLKPFYTCSKSLLFHSLWNEKALLLKQAGTKLTSLDDVANHMWKPVYDHTLKTLFKKVADETMQLGDIDKYLTDNFNEAIVLRKELFTLADVYNNTNTGWIETRSHQIFSYRGIQQQADMAKHLLSMKDSLNLRGDFEALKTLSEMGQPSFKNKELRQIDQGVIAASKVVEQVGFKQLRCLEEAAKAPEFIKWMRAEIKDVNELKVFVDLAMIQAGETDLEMDRVSCFHGAAMGYAPIIFDLKDNSDCNDLLEACKKLWSALDSDPELPLKLRDAKRYIHWLRGIKVEQQGGETPAISQLESINSRGTYIIGKLLDNTFQMEGKKLQGVSLILKVKGSTGLTITTEDRLYTVEELKDLQGKLNLVVGEKQKESGKSHIDYFIQVFTAAQQVADAYEDLCKAGCLLFSQWKVTLYCQRLGKVSVHVDFGSSKPLSGKQKLLKELDALRKFLRKCLADWREYMDTERSKSYHLNYYTTEQVVFLRQSLTVFRRNATRPIDPQHINPQVLALLSSVKRVCSPKDIQDAVKSVVGEDDPTLKHGKPDASEKDSTATESRKDIKDVKKDALRKLVRKLQRFKFPLEHIEAAFQELGEDKSLNEYKGSLELSLAQLWTEYLTTMKQSDLEDCLSLQHLGQILSHLAKKGCHCQMDLETMQAILQQLPGVLCGTLAPEEVLPKMEENGAITEDDLKKIRGQPNNQKRVQLLLRILRRKPLSSYDTFMRTLKATRPDLHKSVKHIEAMQISRYRLLILCSSRKDESSQIVTALNTYRVDIPKSDQKLISNFMYIQFQKEAAAEGSTVARRINPHGGAIEVVLSHRSGVGKSLRVKRHSAALREQLKGQVAEPVCVTIPLHESQVNENNIVKILLQHQKPYGTPPRLFHIDVAPMVTYGLDHFLFTLLVTGGVRDSEGHVWRRNPHDLYVIEITDNADLNISDVGSRGSVPFHAFLPTTTCNAPTDVQHEIQRKEPGNY
ncbi:E3 ubiquitin-protein ligase rnf213-alpha-like [Amphiura filiformis]|uniref:E3 ubiquitin-protein ligase rnf213-alpha-like n=1 Tax=Amphiura filiformis TaxID=82378 RepID=UPI003B21BE73